MYGVVEKCDSLIGNKGFTKKTGVEVFRFCMGKETEVWGFEGLVVWVVGCLFGVLVFWEFVGCRFEERERFGGERTEHKKEEEKRHRKNG